MQDPSVIQPASGSQLKTKWPHLAEAKNTEASREHCPRAILDVTPRLSSEPVPTGCEEHRGLKAGKESQVQTWF